MVYHPAAGTIRVKSSEHLPPIAGCHEVVEGVRCAAMVRRPSMWKLPLRHGGMMCFLAISINLMNFMKLIN
jgi:hypothetical protein